MKEYIEGSLNGLSKSILKQVSSNETFLNLAMKEKPEKLPFIIKSTQKVHTQNYKEFEFHTINEKSKNHMHIIYFHGGGFCLKGGMPQWMMINQWVKHTDAKTSYIIYPMIPHYKTKEIYEISFEIYRYLLTLYPNDKFILIGDSAGCLVILSMLQLMKIRSIKAPVLNILLSPWIDFSLSNPEISKYQEIDKLISVSRFAGLQDYDNTKESSDIVSPLCYRYEDLIHIYTGTEDMLFPDMLLFEEKNPQVKMKIFNNCPHVFMMLPTKQSKIVHEDIIKSIQNQK